MANVRVDVNYTIKDGSEIVFRSPVDCSAITGLIVYYPAEDGNTTSKELALADAHGNNVGDIDHLFAENVVVKVILDVTHAMAFVQNADTNAYIERTFIKTVNGTAPDENGNVNVEGGSGGIAVETDPTVPAWAKQPNKPTYTAEEVGAQPSGNYALKTEIPTVPVKSVNGKTGAVVLSASDVSARSSLWLPTYTEIGAEKSGTAASAVSTHNTKTDAHNDIRLLITALTTRLDALADSDDETLDQMAEVVAYIKANRDLIDQITTGKVSVSDIVNNLTTNVTNKPLSAAQGVALKALIDAITVPTKVSQLTNDSGYLASSDMPSIINAVIAALPVYAGEVV